MSNKRVPDAVLQKCVDMLAMYGSHNEAARRMNIPPNTFKDRIAAAARINLQPSPEIEDQTNPFHLRQKIKRLETALNEADKDKLTHTIIKSKIIGLTNQVNVLEPPAWMLKAAKRIDSPGVPSLFVSDMHWAEVVDPKQINGVNEYNIAIANRRLERLAERAIRLLGILSPSFDYPGIVLPFGGDGISGNIHDELTATNEMNSMPAVLDLFAAKCRLIETLKQKIEFIFCPCVTGNHGRDTRKIWNKDRHATSFDWLNYCFLAKHFENDPQVKFYIPDGPDAFYRIYAHRYLLTHGDQFRGGDGMIGALGPILRGDHKKRSRNSQINMEYETMLMGHWHQDIFTRRVIVNSSLKGYDEYAYDQNFGFEPPSQQLWITHPKYGITWRMPVLVGEFSERQVIDQRDWVSVTR